MVNAVPNSSTNVLVFGARGLVDPNVDSNKKNPFLLSQKEWVSVQRYVESALQLPITEAQMRIKLGMQAGDDITNFMKIVTGYDDPANAGNTKINGYRDVYNHCNDWKQQTYPLVVGLAHDIRHYANDAPVYYDEIIEAVDFIDTAVFILEELEETGKRPEVPSQYDTLKGYSKDDLKAWINRKRGTVRKLLKDRREKADEYASKAAQAFSKVKEFADNCAEDSKDLNFLLENFTKQYTTQGTDVQTIKQQIKDLERDIKDANEDYDHAVVVAATTPTYAWVPVFGMIAAGVVAGIYTDKAITLKKSINRMNDRLSALKRDEKSKVLMETYLKNAKDGLESITSDLNAAKDTISKIQGIWEAISKDLQEIGKKLSQSENQDVVDATTGKPKTIVVPEDIQQAKLKAAKADWKRVGDAADSFVVNAYIQVAPQAAAA